MTGKTISHYRVLEKLGEGRMGVANADCGVRNPSRDREGAVV